MIKIKKGQLWKSKESKKIIRICQKWSGNRHWAVVNVKNGKAHHIHEGTLFKYYEILGDDNEKRNKSRQ